MGQQVLKAGDPPHRRPINIRGAYIPRTVLRNADLSHANLAEANATGVDFRGANMTGTILTGTILKGALLSGVIGLSIEQLRQAIIDDQTQLPDYIDRSSLL